MLRATGSEDAEQPALSRCADPCRELVLGRLVVEDLAQRMRVETAAREREPGTQQGSPVGEHLLPRLRGTLEHERAPVAFQQRRRRGDEPPVQSKQAYDPIHGLPQQHRDRGGLDLPEPEALVAQPVHVVAWVAAGQPQPRP